MIKLWKKTCQENIKKLVLHQNSSLRVSVQTGVLDFTIWCIFSVLKIAYFCCIKVCYTFTFTIGIWDSIWDSITHSVTLWAYIQFEIQFHIGFHIHLHDKFDIQLYIHIFFYFDVQFHIRKKIWMCNRM